VAPPGKGVFFKLRSRLSDAKSTSGVVVHNSVKSADAISPKSRVPKKTALAVGVALLAHTVQSIVVRLLHACTFAVRISDVDAWETKNRFNHSEQSRQHVAADRLKSKLCGRTLVRTDILFIYVYRGFVQYEEIPSHSSADGCGETFRRILACVGA